MTDEAGIAAAQSRGRLEDDRFLTGLSSFTEDLLIPDCLHAVFVRSSLAHAEIGAVTATAARNVPGVVAVFTGADLAADGVGPLPSIAQLASLDGSPNVEPPRPALALDRVRHVGEPVAVVIADSQLAALDGAAAVTVEYRSLRPVIGLKEAMDPGTEPIWPQAPGNLCFDWEKGDPDAVDVAFARAAHLAQLTSACNRVAGSPLETRAAIGEYDAACDRVTLHTPSQAAHLLHDLLCDKVLRLSPEKLRVVTPDVGGGFGLKFFLYPEHVVVAWATRLLKRPVRWIGERRESFMSDTHARDQRATCTLALAEDGRFLALRVESDANLGAYLSTYAIMIPTEGAAKVASGVYDIPAMHMRVRGVFTNTVPVDAYRGAGKPEMVFLLERLVDIAAHDTGRDPLALRRLNMIPPTALPCSTALGVTYDSGDFPKLLDSAQELADCRHFPQRRRLSQRRGRLRGFGVSCYLHVTGGFDRERTRVEVAPEGHVLAFTGTLSNGQGHETAFAEVAARVLGLERDRIRVRQGDTAVIPTGGGSGGSSSAIISANSIMVAGRAVLERARQLASHVFEAADGDIVYEKGRFSIVGTDRSISLFDLSCRAEEDTGLPEGLKGRLMGEASFGHTVASAPSGVIAAEVEVDPETGRVWVERLSSVQDIGTMLNPVLVAGQIHGGIAQSLGQALLEQIIYDSASGELLTDSYMSYTLPRAPDLPFIETETFETPSPNNPLGIKGAGELGTVGAPAAVINAVVDAVSALGVRHLDMPATPERLWRALEEGKRRLNARAGAVH